MPASALTPIFVSHGSPMIALEPGAAGAFLRRLGPAMDAAFGRPKAILAVSAHCMSRAPVLLAAARHQAIYDFSGFDPRLNRLRYDAPGAPLLAGRVVELLAAAGIAAHRFDEHGLDHGLWTALRHVYPDADVPVLPLAFVPKQAPADQFALGEALSNLAAEGVLVLASGGITHNLQRVFEFAADANDAAPEIAESAAFRAWFSERSAARDWDALLDYRRQAPHAPDMHPSDEHLLPWYVAAGAGGRNHAPLRLYSGYSLHALGMDAYAFGAQAPALADALKRGG